MKQPEVDNDSALAAKEEKDDHRSGTIVVGAANDVVLAAAPAAASLPEAGRASEESYDSLQHSTAAVIVGQTRCRDASGYVGTIYFDGTIPTCATSSGGGNNKSSGNPKKNSASDKSAATNAIKTKRYYGVIWDDPTRGRHDGSVVDPTSGYLVRHMRVSPDEHENARHPTSSSFVLPPKLDLGRPLSYGLLLERYVRRHNPHEFEQHVVNCGGTSSNRKTKPIELVGLEKIVSQQQVEILSTISMRFMGINHIPENVLALAAGDSVDDDEGDSKTFGHGLKRCTHVDLAGNLLTNWDDVRRLLVALPHLRNVSVAHNRFVDASLVAPPKGSVWSQQLVQLNLSKCNLRTSRTLVVLGRAVPALESLCCAYADLRDLEPVLREVQLTSSGTSNCCFAHVRELDVTSCQLTTAHLPFLSDLFPGVSVLNLTNNQVESWPEGSVFAHLTHLQWTVAPAQQQSSSHEDSHQPDLLQRSLKNLVEAYHNQLISLRIDVAEPSPASSSSSSLGAHSKAVPVPCKLLLIACLGKLQLWNASRISDQERKDAEIYLLRHVDRDGYSLAKGTASLSPATTSPSQPQFLIKCPRYDELMKLHPNALHQDRSSGQNGSGGTLMNLVTVEFRSLCPHSCDRPPVIRKLPVTLTLGRLKAMLARHFDLDADLQELSWVVQSDGAPPTNSKRPGEKRHDQALPTPLNEHDSSTLEQCGLVHGAVVFMNEREISPREKENHHQAMLDRRIQQQEHELAEFERRKRALAGGAV
jgi:tubulin-specific chaperone E